MAVAGVAFSPGCCSCIEKVAAVHALLEEAMGVSESVESCLHNNKLTKRSFLSFL